MGFPTGGSRSGAPFAFSDAGVQIAAPTPPELVLGVSGFFSVSTGHLGDFNRGDYTVREDVTKQAGRHELHFGGEAVRVSNDLVNTFTMSGQFTFGNQLSGNNLSDFILGTPSRFLQGGGEFKRIKGTLYSLFVQDTSDHSQVEGGSRPALGSLFSFTEEDGKVSATHLAQSRKLSDAPVGLIFGGSNADPGALATGSATKRRQFLRRASARYRL